MKRYVVWDLVWSAGTHIRTHKIFSQSPSSVFQGTQIFLYFSVIEFEFGSLQFIFILSKNIKSCCVCVCVCVQMFCLWFINSSLRFIIQAGDIYKSHWHWECWRQSSRRILRMVLMMINARSLVRVSLIRHLMMFGDDIHNTLPRSGGGRGCW